MATQKAHRIVRKLAEAGQKHSEDAHERLEVAQQLLKVKRLSTKPQAKKRLREELEVLEDMMASIMSLQGDLLRKEDEQTSDIKKELRDLRLKLHLIESGELAQKIDRIQFLLSELNARVNNYVEIKTARDKRIEALEKKIQQQVSSNYKEIIKMEKTIEHLEGRYDDLKSSGKYRKDQLQRVESKIEGLRDLVLKKRSQMVDSKAADLGPLQPRRTQKPKPRQEFLPKPKPLLPKKEPTKIKFDVPPKTSIPQGRLFPKQEFIPKDDELPPFPEEPKPSRHRMLFPGPKEGKDKLPIPPPAPPLGELGDLPLPPPKRHRSGIMHFFKHMLGKE